jgi:hypothetical protein
VDDGAVRVEYQSEQNVFGDDVQLQYKNHYLMRVIQDQQQNLPQQSQVRLVDHMDQMIMK